MTRLWLCHFRAYHPAAAPKPGSTGARRYLPSSLMGASMRAVKGPYHGRGKAARGGDRAVHPPSQVCAYLDNLAVAHHPAPHSLTMGAAHYHPLPTRNAGSIFAHLTRRGWCPREGDHGLLTRSRRLRSSTTHAAAHHRSCAHPWTSRASERTTHWEHSCYALGLHGHVGGPTSVECYRARTPLDTRSARGSNQGCVGGGLVRTQGARALPTPVPNPRVAFPAIF